MKPFTHLGVYIVHYFTGNVNLKRERKFLIEICNILGLHDLFFFTGCELCCPINNPRESCSQNPE